MKITSLNVNQFLGLGTRNEYPSNNPEKKEKKWTELKNQIINIISDSLDKEDDILFLQEMPYKMYPKHFGPNSVKVSNVYLDLQRICDNKKINIYKTNCNCDIFKTIALSKGVYEYPVNEEIIKETFRLNGFEDSRLVVLKKSLTLNNKELYLIGIHNIAEPYPATLFLRNLEELIKRYLKNKNVIVCGDVNIYNDNILKGIEQRFLSETDLCDAWLSKGFDNDDEKGFTYYTKNIKTRIDKFFINKEKISSYEIKVGKEIENGISDHNSISLIINEIKECCQNI